MVCGTASDLKYCLTLKHEELWKQVVLDHGLDVVLCTRRCKTLAIGNFMHRDISNKGFYSQFLRILLFSKSQFSCTHLDPSWCCQWPAIFLGNTEFLREAENLLAESHTEICLSFWGPIKKIPGSLCSQGNRWTKKKNCGKGLRRHSRIWSLFLFGNSQVAHRILCHTKSHAFASLHPPYAMEYNF